MSFSITNGSTALSLLQGMNQSSGSDLISILYGGGSTSSTDPVSALSNAETNETQDVAQQEKDPETASDIAHFLAVAKSAPNLKTLLADPIAAKVFLTANGLGDQVGYTALAVQALSSDPSQSNNLASTLSDPAWLSTAQSTPGIAAALDFRARASTFTTADQILGDANVRAVVTGALGIPEQIAFQPLEAQEKAITDRLDISKLQDPAFVEQLAREYVINNNSSGATSSTGLTSGNIVSLFA
jgi:hypothetical protein